MGFGWKPDVAGPARRCHRATMGVLDSVSDRFDHAFDHELAWIARSYGFYSLTDRSDFRIGKDRAPEEGCAVRAVWAL